MEMETEERGAVGVKEARMALGWGKRAGTRHRHSFSAGRVRQRGCRKRACSSTDAAFMCRCYKLLGPDLHHHVVSTCT